MDAQNSKINFFFFLPVKRRPPSLPESPVLTTFLPSYSLNVWKCLTPQELGVPGWSAECRQPMGFWLCKNLNSVSKLTLDTSDFYSSSFL